MFYHGRNVMLINGFFDIIIITSDKYFRRKGIRDYQKAVSYFLSRCHNADIVYEDH